MLLASATTPQNVFVATTKILSSAGCVLSKHVGERRVFDIFLKIVTTE